MKVIAILATALLAVSTPTMASADGSDNAACGSQASLKQASSLCEYEPETVSDFYASGDGHVYTINLACGVGGSTTCFANVKCQGDPDPLLYDLLRDGIVIGTVCLDDSQAGALGTVTPARVLTAFQTLAWPASELIIQPPDGTTLVNIETNFYTTNTSPVTRTVTLLGRQITIEATPASYTWHFDPTHSATTTSPGARYPDLAVTHTYTDAGVTVQPSVDTTYTGRYRIGTGPWQTIPGTVTITGPATSLNVIEARGILVGN